MADEDELYYLQPGFDINTLTVPRIRSILVSQNVDYPGSAKKGQLLEILQAQVIPNSKKLLRTRDRVRRTSKGITDVPSSQDGTLSADDDDDDRELMPPPPPPKTPRSRKSKTNLLEAEVATPATTKRTRTPGTRKSTSRTPRVSDTDTDADKPKPSARKSRKSLAEAAPIVHSAPRVQLDEPDRRLKRESVEAGSSPFSDDNPFQSGSPEPSSHRISSASRNRKSLEPASTCKSTSRRRETTSPIIVKREADTSSKASYRFPVTRVNADEPADGVYTTEEFTEDAAQELAREDNGQLVRKRTSALVRRKKPTSTAVKTAPLAVLTTILAGIAGWYRQEKIDVGYCGVGQPNWSLASNHHIPTWVHESLQPTCEPCPPHAICYPNMEVKCDDDFILQHHPLSLNGVVPLPPTCLPDSEKERRIKVVADRAIDELRSRRAAYECGEDLSTAATSLSATPIEDVQTVVKAEPAKLEVTEEALKNQVKKLRRKGMNNEEFEDLWRSALGDIKSRDEIEIIHDDKTGRVYLTSSSLAKVPFSCAVRRWSVRTAKEFRLPLAVIILLSVASAYLRHRVITYKQATAQIPSLVATTLDRLATQAVLKEDGRTGEGFISIAQLRDDVLRNVFSVRERERVWRDVRKVVEGNSNVRAATREGGKTGEWSRVWEWIGPVDLAPGIEGRRSGGFIKDRESPVRIADVDADADSYNANSGGRRQSGGLEMRKWDEGRPIY